MCKHGVIGNSGRNGTENEMYQEGALRPHLQSASLALLPPAGANSGSGRKSSFVGAGEQRNSTPLFINICGENSPYG